MNNIITRTTELAMAVTLTYLKEGDTAVDATCGNGFDTVALAEAVGKTGQVIGFDIQKKALILTEGRLISRGITNVKLFKSSFTEMGDHIPEGSASCVIFNLGYLPGGDHSITSQADITLKGLGEALKVIKKGGVLTIVMYDGHEEGKEEKKQILDWAQKLDPGIYHAAYVNFINQPNDPPEILWVTKKRD